MDRSGVRVLIVSQLEFSIYVSTIAVTLLNFGSKPNSNAFIVAGAFTFLAVLCLCYSVGTYLYRSQAIRTRRSSAKFYDKVGPTVLCLAMVVAVALNFGFESYARGWW